MNDEDVAQATGPRRVEISSSGDLSVHGADLADVRVDADPECVEMTESEGVVRIVLTDDGSVSIPEGAELAIDEVSGDAAISGATGVVSVGNVNGDLALSGVGQCSIAEVGGDLSLRGASGDVTIEQVGGDAAVYQVQGNLAAEEVGADLVLRAIEGDISATAGADIDVSIRPVAGRSYSLTAGADIDCRLPDDAGLVITVAAGAGPPRVRIPGAREPEPVDEGYRIVFGDGGATAQLTAGARVTLRGLAGDEDSTDVGAAFGEEFGRMAEEIARQVEAQTARLTIQLGDHLSKLTANLPGVLAAAGLEKADADRIAQRTERSLDRAAEKTRHRAEAAVHRMEVRLAHTERRLARDVRRAEDRRSRGGPYAPGWPPAPPVPPAPPREPVTDAERMAILRMLQEGRVTIDEAERLLSALEA